MARELAPTHDLILLGRRPERLEEVAEQARAIGASVRTVPFDVTTGDAVALMTELGGVDDLVLAAGLNSPRRAWNDQSMVEFRAVVETNLLGVADVIGAALPSLRDSGGTVVVVSSLSAWTTSPGAGVAYRASKTALRALTDSLNEQEAVHGVRASHVCPGDIDTEFLSHRPSVPTAEPRRSMLGAEDVARAIGFILTSPPHVRIDELVLSPLGTVER